MNRMGVCALLALTSMTGCARYIGFTTATKFALDISQKADQTIDVSMGYDRAEMASIPATKRNATDSVDTYAVLGRFSVHYGNPWADDPLVLKQFFATGIAARNAAASPGMRKVFGTQAGLVEAAVAEGTK